MVGQHRWIPRDRASQVSSSGSLESGQSPNTRWWESYLVRYFSGFVVGGIFVFIVVAFIYFKLNPKAGIILTLVNIAKEKGVFSALLLASGILGAVYSYLVSSPITVIHYGRGGGKSFFEYQARYFWFSWLIILVIAMIDVGLIYDSSFSEWNFFALLISGLFLHWASHRRWRSILDDGFGFPILLSFTLFWMIYLFCLLNAFLYFLKSASLLQKYLLILSLPVFWIAFAQYATLYKLLCNASRTHEFYQKLTKARGKKGAKDIRETYTHLREHSNSTFIVVIEFCFSCAILLLVDFHLGGNSTDGLRGDEGASIFFRVGALLMIWCIPNLFLWSRANRLEQSFADNPEKYIR